MFWTFLTPSPHLFSVCYNLATLTRWLIYAKPALTHPEKRHLSMMVRGIKYT